MGLERKREYRVRIRIGEQVPRGTMRLIVPSLTETDLFGPLAVEEHTLEIGVSPARSYSAAWFRGRAATAPRGGTGDGGRGRGCAFFGFGREEG